MSRKLHEASADDLGFASGSFNLGDCSLGECFSLDSDCLGDLAVGKDLDGQLSFAKEALGAEAFGVNDVAGSKFALNDAQVHQLENNPVSVLEAPLGQTPEEGNLTALKEGTDNRTGTGLLSLIAAACGLTQSGAVTATNPFAGFAGAGSRFHIMQFHNSKLRH